MDRMEDLGYLPLGEGGWTSIDTTTEDDVLNLDEFQTIIDDLERNPF